MEATWSPSATSSKFSQLLTTNGLAHKIKIAEEIPL